MSRSTQKKLASNIEELKKILKEMYKKWSEATEFLEAIESNVNELEDENIMLEEDNNSKNSRITELEEMIESSEGLNSMDCGIVEINYEQPNNIVLQDVMENLETAIKKTNPKVVNSILEAI